MIQQSEEKDTSARMVRLAEMRRDFEGLHKVWRAIEGFTRPIPDDAVAAFRKRSALLETEISRRSLLQRRGITAGVVAVLILGSQPHGSRSLITGHRIWPARCVRRLLPEKSGPLRSSSSS